MRMIGQRTDIIPRDSCYEEVMNGKAMMLLLPLGESLGKWIKKWDYELGRSVKTLDT